MKSLLSIVAVCALGSVGCRNTASPPKTVIFDVASISVPSTITPSQSLDVVLNVERGACQSFDRIYAQRSTTGVVLTVLGSDPEKGCTDQLVVETRTYHVEPPLEVGTFAITVNRASSPPLSTLVTVQ